MFNLMIIDDEPIIRKGIRSVINWEELGCTVCAEAEDGQEGRELIERLKPDIIITDIKMPEVDGLTMIRDIKDVVPNCKVIILTGYRDFDYAYQAIKLGAFDFLLKPTKLEQLHDVVKRAVTELKTKASSDPETERLRKLYEKNLPLIREKFLYNMLTGVATGSQSVTEEAQQLGIDVGLFQVVMVENDNSRDAQDDGYNGNPLYQFGITSAFEEAFSGFYSVQPVSLNSRRTAFVLSPKAEAAKSSSGAAVCCIENCCSNLQNMVKSCFGFGVTVTVSSEGFGFGELSVKYRECCEAFKHSFYLGSQTIIFYDRIGSQIKQNDAALYECNNRLFELVKAGDVDGVSQCTAELLTCITSMGLTDKEYIRRFYFDTITVINTIRASALIADDSLPPQNAGEGNLYNMIERCDNVGDLNGLLESVARRAAAKIGDYDSGSMKLLLRKAVDYLNKHYSDPITLQQMADEIYVSPSYISRMFKKELGVNFVDYLNEIRISRAKDLLGDINYKTYEVADSVGISNPHYFSKLFRRYVGMTPSEYKELLSRTTFTQ
ncbi:response regulator [Acetanaerobacterium elongatum]|uniref:Stage 0 sporulation protein A homolog n=1 Tax=Acetanaerobacterium elongatum TaxID=258515 RepID=A0A1G9W973_9FIRM|nr:response regulator [Acetanaerobacterium elongatum]SDM80999.1 two component transcriptional regulator, AraC family [Acetanaerobacterium elongatum]